MPATTPGRRSTVYPLDAVLEAEPGTPGFNLFPKFEALADYLHRFRVRAPNLMACQIWYDDDMPSSPRSNYARAREMYIASVDWDERIPGHKILVLGYDVFRLKF